MNLRSVTVLLFLLLPANVLHAQSAMTNISGRQVVSLNGSWKALIDPTGTGDWLRIWEERTPVSKTDFVEYSFTGAPELHVPGDFNTQRPEYTYLEGTVWYKQTFSYTRKKDKRLFLYFGAVNYLADVYLNGKHLGAHEGGFTPFQFELTDVQEGVNSIIVRVNNTRQKNGLPALSYDWFNYGGITREVSLVETASTYINDYLVQLTKHSDHEIAGWVKLDGGNAGNQEVKVSIPELKISYRTKTNDSGMALLRFNARPVRWSPDTPRLYNVIISSVSDTVTERIGFRNIAVSGTDILLNGRKLFIKGVNIHEERPFKAGKANSEADARVLLSWAKELGCNMVRLSHYPHNEYMVKLAEEMGIMVWDELPVYQHIAFADTSMPGKMELMLREMIKRDRNRCAVTIWSLSNETYSFTPSRDKALIELISKCRMLDTTRLNTVVINNQGYSNNMFHVHDSLYKYADIISLNEYIGWYVPWQGKPEDVKWEINYKKPVIISEFGGEAKYGNAGDVADSWSEDYQAKIYRDQVAMFRRVPQLAGVCAWLLVDYRSMGRMRPGYQDGYNRKGLLSEYGERKRAWYVLRGYYDEK